MVNAHHTRSVTPQTPLRSAFTLVELLVVMAIMVVMLIAMFPMLPSLLGQRGVSKAALEIPLLLEQARTKAITTNSYVYVCFENTTAQDGTGALRGLYLIYPGGKPRVATDRGVRGLKLAVPIQKWEGVHLVAFDTISPAVRSLRKETTDMTSVATLTPLTFADVLGQGKADELLSFAFSPTGYALISKLKGQDTHGNIYHTITMMTPYERWLEFSLKPYRNGGVDDEDPNQAAIILNGGNGNTQVLRL